ncbi:MAG TPA: YfiR family protein [Planctomycetota bacterium]|nr:YfiR family protein [Planctomycetota bacterium]
MALLSTRQSSAASGRAIPHLAWIALLAALVCAPPAPAQPQASEVNLKSAFLYKFIHYAEWPPEALGAPGDPIALCVIGQDEIAQVLEDAVRGRTIHERPLVVHKLAGSEPAAGCHVLFVGVSLTAQIDRVLARVAAQPTLTVGDAEGFAQRGGIINFTRSGSRLGFEINRAAAQRAGLQLSSQLLKLSKLVPEEGSE